MSDPVSVRASQRRSISRQRVAASRSNICAAWTVKCRTPAASGSDANARDTGQQAGQGQQGQRQETARSHREGPGRGPEPVRLSAAAWGSHPTAGCDSAMGEQATVSRRWACSAPISTTSCSCCSAAAAAAEARFFTTDLDALLLHPAAQTRTRNLLVASGFGLRLRPDIQSEIPPFRSNYQTAEFLADARCDPQRHAP